MEKLYEGSTETNPQMFKNFFRVYYKERLRTLNIILTVWGLVFIAAGAYMYAKGFGLLSVFIAVWIGLVIIIYPRNAYRKPARSMRGKRIVTRFEFYENYMTEQASGERNTINYGELYKVIETGQYFYIFHTKESASILEKSDLKKGTPESLAAFLKTKTNYKRLR